MTCIPLDLIKGDYGDTLGPRPAAAGAAAACSVDENGDSVFLQSR